MVAFIHACIVTLVQDVYRLRFAAHPRHVVLPGQVRGTCRFLYTSFIDCWQATGQPGAGSAVLCGNATEDTGAAAYTPGHPEAAQHPS